MKTDIVLAGVGGQGILSLANVIGFSALKDQLFLKQSEVHGMSQRGGDVQSNLRISSSPIHSDLISLKGADLIVALEPMEALRYQEYLSPKGWVVTNTTPVLNIENYPDLKEIMKELEKIDNLIAFDMDAVAKNIGSPRSANMVLLGAASPFLGLKEDTLIEGIETLFRNKGEKITQLNIEAFKSGRVETINFLNSRHIPLIQF